MNHREFTDTDFVSVFSDLSFPPQLFSHEAHLRLAFLLIQRDGIAIAAEELCTLIRRYDAHHGDGNKFHRTLTVAAAHIVHHFMQRMPEAPFEELLRCFPRLKDNFAELLKSHYRMDRLQSPQAKQSYLAPDLLPFS